MWWWLSFCDTEKPEGQQFLGACFVRGTNMIAAVKNARPGPFTMSPADADTFRNLHVTEEARLLEDLDIDPVESPDLEGFIGLSELGWNVKRPIYASSAIPNGYFYEGGRVASLHGQEIPEDDRRFVEKRLHPFILGREVFTARKLVGFTQIEKDIKPESIVGGSV